MAERAENKAEHYPGGKGRSYQHVINLMPPHRRYIESHVGGGAVLRRKRPAAESIIIDLDRTVTDRWQARNMKNVVVRNGDALRIIPELDVSQDDLIYADPPYLPATRRTRRYYRYDYDEADHVALLNLLSGLPCKVVLSGYRSDLYDRHLAGWTRTDYTALTHNGLVTESAWTNFQPGSVLHDYRYIGSDFREREASKRRRENLFHRIATVDPVERNAVLAELAATHPEAVLQAARRIAA
ncbi:DNA adenine methylase [Sphingomonas sp. SORGH_AS 950]|uniref:DNA adenine methylase n=1 Tax=Sphingomonas sp. SORGH_AS_0950 TaxID=3041792 RepID=UPI00277FC979|nr:DNA adenine methylase [Sphingomonas sp. SORGH_AS_0950]MDQ1158536.1 DNA adenine methylase [Sphingomonas sp. SORGH_AS_0950]